uniref:Uncharacterized protein n=1 Tax=viral metagenome TaxID=1070528 RepID=A0A6H2A3A5_9ZZZZ
MTIDEAITILEWQAIHQHNCVNYDFEKAIKLGIGALQITKIARRNGDLPSCLVLKGEIMENERG